MSSLVLNTRDCLSRLKRIAYEILERNHPNRQFILLGIEGRGYYLAQQLQTYLQEIAGQTFPCHSIARNDAKAVSQTLQNQIHNNIAILIDDVLYTGETLFKATTQIAALNPKAIQLAVLIDRGHKNFPIAPTFVGLELGTTLQDYIKVEIDPNNSEFIQATLS